MLKSGKKVINLTKIEAEREESRQASVILNKTLVPGVGRNKILNILNRWVVKTGGVVR